MSQERDVEETRDETAAAGHFNEQERAKERGDTAEPDAPVEIEENEGMSTILDGEAGVGVQDNLGE